MVTGVLFLMVVLLALLLAAFIYQIVTTPLIAVDAPTLMRSAAAPSAEVPALPVRRSRARTVPAATGSASGASAPGASRRLQSWIAGVLAIAGLAAVLIGGWLFLHIAHGAAACSHQAIEVCSQGFVLLTSTQLAGGAIAVAGIGSVVIAAVLAVR
jgi:hypothetical protein